jgi:hypothetical protein
MTALERRLAESLDHDRLRRARHHLELAAAEVRQALEELDALSIPASELLRRAGLERDLHQYERELAEAGNACRKPHHTTAHRHRLEAGVSGESSLGGKASRGGA